MKTFLKWITSLAALCVFAWIDKNWLDYEFSFVVFVYIAIFAVWTAALIEDFFNKAGLIALILLLPAAPALAQESQILGTVGISGARGLGYPRPDISVGSTGAYRRKRFALAGEFQAFLRADKTEGDGRALRFDLGARYYVAPRVFAGGGFEAARQSVASVTRSAFRPRIFAGFNHREKSLFLVGYSFPDRTSYRAQSIDFRFDFYKALSRRWLARISVEARWVMFDVSGQRRDGLRVSVGFGAGKGWGDR